MSPVFPRYAAQNLREALKDSPATLIHGPRQCGKTTLALDVGKVMEYGYLSFDNKVVRSGAKADPIGFVQDLPTRIILDGPIAGIEIKAAASVTAKDFRSLKKLAAALGERFVAGVVLYDGETLTRFGDGLYAVPISALWQPE